MTRRPENSQSPYAVLIGLDSMQGLQAARILAARDVPVFAITENLDYFTSRTRVCDEIVYAQTSSKKLIDTLVELGPRFSLKPVLYPCQDHNVLLVSRHRKKLEQWYHVVLPTSEAVEMLMDKVAFYTWAQAQNLPIPKTCLIHNQAEAEQAAREMIYPCVMKPPMRSAAWMRETGQQKAIRIASAEELLSCYEAYGYTTDTIIVQQWIKGSDADLYSCNVYFDRESRPLVSFTARKIRQWPPLVGQSCLGEECRNDVVLEETLRLFQSVNYKGLGYLEMKQDSESGEYLIVEPNIGRPTGRSAIAEAGGVELLYTKYCDTIGQTLPSNIIQQYQGVKWIHLIRDIQSSFYYWRQGELSLREWWKSRRGKKTYAIFSWSDPAPFVWALCQQFCKSLSSPTQKANNAS